MKKKSQSATYPEDTRMGFSTNFTDNHSSTSSNVCLDPRFQRLDGEVIASRVTGVHNTQHVHTIRVRRFQDFESIGGSTTLVFLILRKWGSVTGFASLFQEEGTYLYIPRTSFPGGLIVKALSLRLVFQTLTNNQVDQFRSTIAHQ